MTKNGRWLEQSQVMWDIAAARAGQPAWMPSVYRRLAAALRSNQLVPEEIEFIAKRLEAIANAVPDGGIAYDDKAAKTALCHALLLGRGRAKTTAYESEMLELQRAYAMHRLVVGQGLATKVAAERLAEEQGHAGGSYEPRPFLDAYVACAGAFTEAGLDGGADPRTKD